MRKSETTCVNPMYDIAIAILWITVNRESYKILRTLGIYDELDNQDSPYYQIPNLFFSHSPLHPFHIFPPWKHRRILQIWLYCQQPEMIKMTSSSNIWWSFNLQLKTSLSIRIATFIYVLTYYFLNLGNW